MIFSVSAAGRLDLGERVARCALGRAGVTPAAEKREGDWATPAGAWPLRRLFWRADRLAAPATRLPARRLRREDAWCDDPTDVNYNRLVSWPYPAGAERLWRRDALYDLLVEIGHNDDPVTPGAGSAIFLHLASEDFAPTRGCVGLARMDMLALLAMAAPGDILSIASSGQAR